MRRLGLFFLLAIAAVGGFSAWLDEEVSRPFKAYAGDSIYVDIPHGTSRWGVSGILAKNGVIRNRLAFELASQWHFSRSLQAGEYLFDHPMTERQVFWKIASGRIFVHTVQIPEGWTMFDIANELQRDGIASREDFLRAAQDPSLVQDIAPDAKTLEGFLFPSTYHFTRHETADQIAETMVRQFHIVWSNLNPNPANPFVSSTDIVTLASLVERETPLATERPLVAGVFTNRLQRKLPLQCDPTVQYALDLAGRPTVIVHHADLQINSPYNTYLHAGLPPGPIANPGEASLRAAISPTQTDFMYFVANDAGGHFFAATLAEHNRNIVKYRRRLESDAAADPAPRTATTTNPNQHRSQP